MTVSDKRYVELLLLLLLLLLLKNSMLQAYPDVQNI